MTHRMASRLQLPELPISRKQRELFLDRAACLPLRKIVKADIESPRFLIASDGPMAVYWCPSDLPSRTNVQTLIIFVGITPGFRQARLAMEVARDAIRTNPRLTYAEICRRANAGTAFAGMRRQMCDWLDTLHVHEWLGIATSGNLFTACQELMAVTSVVRYPVFINGNDYSGSNGGLLTRHRVLLPFTTTLLSADLRRNPQALVVPLGVAVGEAVQYLVSHKLLNGERVLFGFPHPSPLNGHKDGQFRANRPNMQRRVDSWFG